ncbi:uncharacterized protein BP01DRAFT_411297 [Aspergillus saccharolyticus JOP 1030-1]|uniref:Uncharacterized protein n=1 Tax=Aspergillus saccharolyticus JOP 1030-1 TaxID=1450539 RepID=A0A318ZKA0_9EURO|nr:hypothetical protein BP01DRAFT_411297 [Aspergillus saccharolyticus JOP 1030-1]PYH47215.1 hypothetical protein BP01DRAFT_411297 [Aspergillus saccharolyticus JOP 1030-1]
MYAGIDGVLHLAEECRDAARVVHRALLSTLVIGVGTSFAFLVAMLYWTDDLDAVVASATGVTFYELWYQARRQLRRCSSSCSAWPRSLPWSARRRRPRGSPGPWPATTPFSPASR